MRKDWRILIFETSGGWVRLLSLESPSHAEAAGEARRWSSPRSAEPERPDTICKETSFIAFIAQAESFETFLSYVHI